jgi:hypothetical protein
MFPVQEFTHLGLALGGSRLPFKCCRLQIVIKWTAFNTILSPNKHKISKKESICRHKKF